MLFYPDEENIRNEENLIWKILQAFQRNCELKICYLENFFSPTNFKLTTHIVKNWKIYWVISRLYHTILITNFSSYSNHSPIFKPHNPILESIFAPHSKLFQKHTKKRFKYQKKKLEMIFKIWD